MAVNPGETGGAGVEVAGTDDVLHILLHCLKCSDDTELVMAELTVAASGSHSPALRCAGDRRQTDGSSVSGASL